MPPLTSRKNCESVRRAVTDYFSRPLWRNRKERRLRRKYTRGCRESAESAAQGECGRGVDLKKSVTVPFLAWAKERGE
jgi:hypothetical protein